MEVLIEKLAEYGTGPVLLAIAFLLGWVVKELKENSRKDEERAEKLRSAMSAQMDTMETRFEERFEASDKKINELTDRMISVERDYVSREEHYRDLSGWREEIRQLGERINNFIMTIMRREGK